MFLQHMTYTRIPPLCIKIEKLNLLMERLSSQLNHTLLLLFAIYLLCSSDQATNFRYCDKKCNYPVKILGVEISPDPVVSGSPATFNISASTDQSVAGGKVMIDVYFFSVNVHHESRDICDEMSCPVAVGDFVLSHTQTLPGFTPPGSYTLKMTMKDDKDDQTLSCISFSFKIRFGSSVSNS